MHEALRLYLEALRTEGLPMPEPNAHAEYMAV